MDQATNGVFVTRKKMALSTKAPYRRSGSAETEKHAANTKDLVCKRYRCIGMAQNGMWKAPFITPDFSSPPPLSFFASVRHDAQHVGSVA
jgi:hypothetical protein